MVDYRTLLAAVLGVALGAVLLAFPEFVVRVQTAGRVPHDRTGEYGEPSEVPDRWRQLVRAVGVALVLAGGYFAYTLVS
ncbi:MAG: hypothetical protein ABEJ40_11855 [Haloarculaceae archaeon]